MKHTKGRWKNKSLYDKHTATLRHFESGTYITHFISFCTQAVVYYFIAYSSLLGKISNPLFWSIVSAIFISFCLEIGQRKAFFAFGKNSFSKEVGTGIKWTLGIVSFAAFLASVVSSSVMVKFSSKTAIKPNVISADSLKRDRNDERLLVINKYKADSAMYESVKAQKIKALNLKIDGANTYAAGRVKYYKTLESAKGKKYTTKIAQYQSRAASEKAKAQTKISAISSNYGDSLVVAANLMNAKISEIDKEFSSGKESIINKNGESESESDNIQWWVKWLGWAIIFFMSCYLAAVMIIKGYVDEKYGQEDIFVPEEKDFLDPAFYRLVRSLNSRLGGWFHEWADNNESKAYIPQLAYEQKVIEAPDGTQARVVTKTFKSKGKSIIVERGKRSTPKREKKKNNNNLNSVNVDENSSLDEIRRFVSSIGANYRTWKSNHLKNPNNDSVKANMERYKAEYERLKTLRDNKKASIVT